MYAITSQWWRRLVNAYGVDAGMVLFAGKLCDPYLSAVRVKLIHTFIKPKMPTGL